jgi:hypothetical protein
MGTDEPRQAANIDLSSRCLASLEADQIASAQRQARRIEDAALRAIAEDQIRLVLDIKACLVNGDVEQAGKLSQARIGGIQRKSQAALENRPVHRNRPPPSRVKAKKPSAGKEGRHPQPDFTDFPAEIRKILHQLTQRIGRARVGSPHPEFSPAVLLQLAWIAYRAWRRSNPGKTFSPIRADASEIRVVGACLRQRIERGGGRLSIEELSGELGLGQAHPQRHQESPAIPLARVRLEAGRRREDRDCPAAGICLSGMKTSTLFLNPGACRLL